MNVIRLSAFADGDTGGNPAGVLLAENLPPPAEMQRIAATVGYSETAFATPIEGGWRVRYFAPAAEVPFCGHATIALGAVLAQQQGDGVFALTLNDAEITVEGYHKGETMYAALQSPPTRSESANPVLVTRALELFGYTTADLDPRIPVALANAGANHLIIGLRSREALRSMVYDFESGRVFMNDASLVTILLGYAESAQRFHTRNPFASGGVYEDPATGAATAALGGYLRDIDWPHGGAVDVVQGEDMGARSLLRAEIPAIHGASVRVSGAVRPLLSDP